MMRDRLLQIKMLLAPDGSVWVHCDDSEQARLKVMMDELFGPAEFVAAIVRQKRYSRDNRPAIGPVHKWADCSRTSVDDLTAFSCSIAYSRSPTASSQSANARRSARSAWLRSTMEHRRCFVVWPTLVGGECAYMAPSATCARSSARRAGTASLGRYNYLSGDPIAILDSISGGPGQG
jgi:hypothetical protein